MIDRWLKKQCNCVAGASGPRMVTTLRNEDGKMRVRTELAMRACDRCHKPWAYEVPAKLKLAAAS